MIEGLPLFAVGGLDRGVALPLYTFEAFGQAVFVIAAIGRIGQGHEFRAAPARFDV